MHWLSTPFRYQPLQIDTFGQDFIFGALLCRQRCNTIHMWNIATRGPIFGVSSPHPPYRGASAEHVFPKGCARIRAGHPVALSVKFFVLGICFGFVFFASSDRVFCPSINASVANPEVLSVTVAYKCFHFFWWPSHGFFAIGIREWGTPVARAFVQECFVICLNIVAWPRINIRIKHGSDGSLANQSAGHVCRLVLEIDFDRCMKGIKMLRAKILNLFFI